MIERYEEVQKLISTEAAAAGRDPTTIQLIAVSKGHPFELIQELYDAGHRDFGENYVQELVEKAEFAQASGMTDIRWHFIGHLQTNKVKALLPWVHSIHAVGSLRLAQEIDKRAEKHTVIPVFIEVNIDREDSKHGVFEEDVPALASAINDLQHLLLQGLMCIPDPQSKEGAAASFRRARELEASLRPHSVGQLSMGMTADFKEAIREGATHLRIGSAIFGPRPAQSDPDEKEEV